MPFGGILEDHGMPVVPGTVTLNEESPAESESSGLPHGKGNVILHPPPSNSPNDPLNWPIGKKLAVISIVSFGTLLYAAVFGPLLNASLNVLAAEFDVSLQSITLLTGEQILVPACMAPLISSLSRKFGKRAMFILASLFALIGTIIGQVSTTYSVVRAARIVQGLSVAPYESLCFVIVGDLFFVHERGVYIALISFILAAISNFSSVVSGSITEKLGWKYLFHIMTAAAGLQFLLVIFFVPETTYNRPTPDDACDSQADNLGDTNSTEIANGKTESTEHVEQNSPASNLIPRKHTYWEELKPWGGVYSHENLFRLFIAPFAVCLNIAVLYITIVQCWILTLYVGIAYTIAQIFGAPPYLLNAQGIGYLSLGPFIGGMLGMIVAGSMADPTIKFMARRNHGIYEPEYRLIPGIIGLLTGLGLFLFGFTTENHESYYITTTTHGVIMFGVMATLSSTSSYVLDAYREMSSEIFIIGMCFKNFLFYGFSFFINDWLARVGPGTVYYIFGGTAFAVLVGTPFLYVFGKKYRRFWAQHNLLEKFNIKTSDDY